MSINRALKISRPSPGKAIPLAKMLCDEKNKLKRLSHQNIIKIYAEGEVLLQDHPCTYPYFIMDYVEGAKRADEFISENRIAEKDVVKIFKGALEAIEYLHANDILHMDIKPGNILVGQDGIVIVSDLGFSKNIKLQEEGMTSIGGTEGFIHPEAKIFFQETASRQAQFGAMAPRNQLKKVWDLYSLGKSFLKLLEVIENNTPKTLSIYTKRYLRLLACRLLDGYNNEKELAVNLTSVTFAEIKYVNISQALTDIEKLTGEYDLETRIPELNVFSQDSIHVTNTSSTSFSARLRNVIKQKAMLRLAHFSQLGLLNLIYPTANHTRLEHSIGVFSVMCRFISSLYRDPLNPLFKQIMDEEDLKVALLAALLHDIGQFPLAHDLEEAYKSFSHSKATILILQNDPDIRTVIQDEWGVHPERIINVFKAKPKELGAPLKDRIINSILDGPIDVDKIDYLVRDGARLGLMYGNAIDLERLLKCLTIVFYEKNHKTYAALGIHEKGKVPAESVAFARYAMYGQVYWHHTYRAIKAMIHQIIWEILSAYNDKERGDFVNKFYEFVVTLKSMKPLQPGLFPDDKQMEGGITQIQLYDIAVLDWIVAKSGNTNALHLIGLLKEASPFLVEIPGMTITPPSPLSCLQ